MHLSMSLRKANEKLGEQKLKISELVSEQVVSQILWEERIAELELERDIANNKLIDCAVKITELQEELETIKYSST
tara:strand:- start:643 stop:870 length:228 start_codon:yes stop_codon:yes gene_type:complete